MPQLDQVARGDDYLGVSRVEEDLWSSSLIPPDVRISRIRRTEGVSCISTRRLSGRHAASLTPDDDKDEHTRCDPQADESHVDFDVSDGQTAS